MLPLALALALLAGEKTAAASLAAGSGAAAIPAAVPRASTLPTPAAKDVSPELLQKLAAADEKLCSLYKQSLYRTTTHFSEADGNGKPKVSTEVVTRLIVKDGKPWEQIEKWMQDGKDETKERGAIRDADLTSGKRKRGESPFKSPFAASQQSLYTFRDLGPDPDAPSRIVIAYAPKKSSKDVEEGTASVDPEAGEVREMSFRPTFHPRFVHAIDVHIVFDSETAAGHAASHLVVVGEGGFLFVKRTFKLDMTLDAFDGVF